MTPGITYTQAHSSVLIRHDRLESLRVEIDNGLAIHPSVSR